MDLARAQKNEDVIVSKERNSYEYSVSFGQPLRTGGHVYFSPKELKHLAAAALLVIGVGLSAGLYLGPLGTALTLVLASSAIILATSFFVHEIAHKVTAQKRGLWAEFRLTTWGAMLTLVFLVLPTPFKLISPGAVMISGSARMEDTGKISIAGPATNIVLSSFLLGAAIVSSASQILLLGALINGYIAVFNLIPFGILDGFKIFNWNKKIWALAFSASVVLTAAAYIMF
jgi:Zn-dependent protease